MLVQYVGCARTRIQHHLIRRKATKTLEEYLSLFTLLSNIFYEKNIAPTSSNIFRKRIQHFLSNMLDDVGPTCWTCFPWPLGNL